MTQKPCPAAILNFLKGKGKISTFGSHTNLKIFFQNILNVVLNLKVIVVLVRKAKESQKNLKNQKILLFVI